MANSPAALPPVIAQLVGVVVAEMRPTCAPAAAGRVSERLALDTTGAATAWTATVTLTTELVPPAFVACRPSVYVPAGGSGVPVCRVRRFCASGNTVTLADFDIRLPSQ